VPLGVLMLPLPSFSVPFQIAVAVRCMRASCGLPDSVRRIFRDRGADVGLNATNCFTLATRRNPALGVPQLC
jgi:hypothetical protein